MKALIEESRLKSVQTDAKNFAAVCLKDDSLIRGYLWSDLAMAIEEVIIEERLHDYTFPSPHNPLRETTE